MVRAVRLYDGSWREELREEMWGVTATAFG